MKKKLFVQVSLSNPNPPTSFQSVEDKAIYSLFQKPDNILQLSTNFQYTDFDLDSKSYSFNQNNLSRESIQSKSSKLLTNPEFVDVDENQESYYSNSSSLISSKGMLLYLNFI